MTHWTETRRHDIKVRLATVQRRVAAVQDEIGPNALHNLTIAQAAIEQAVGILQHGHPNKQPPNKQPPNKQPPAKYGCPMCSERFETGGEATYHIRHDH